MKWLLALHVISMVCWFAGLFYLPRLFVYHASTHDTLGIERFKIMEHKLYYYITTPAALLTTFFGLWLLFLQHSYYATLNWMHLKLFLVAILWAYHLSCGYLTMQFKRDTNQYSEKFYRFYNEAPILLLIAIIILVVVQPDLGPNWL